MQATNRFKFFRQAAVLATVLAGLSAGSLAQDSVNQYTVTNLVSNTAMTAPTTDSNLQNAWGLSRSSSSPWWVSDNGSGLSTLYSVNSTATSASTLPVVVTIPPGIPPSP